LCREFALNELQNCTLRLVFFLSLAVSTMRARRGRQGSGVPSFGIPRSERRSASIRRPCEYTLHHDHENPAGPGGEIGTQMLDAIDSAFDKKEPPRRNALSNSASVSAHRMNGLDWQRFLLPALLSIFQT